jgi:hypothetical protein
MRDWDRAGDNEVVVPAGTGPLHSVELYPVLWLMKVDPTRRARMYHKERLGASDRRRHKVRRVEREVLVREIDGVTRREVTVDCNLMRCPRTPTWRERVVMEDGRVVEARLEEEQPALVFSEHQYDPKRADWPTLELPHVGVRVFLRPLRSPSDHVMVAEFSLEGRAESALAELATINEKKEQ